MANPRKQFWMSERALPMRYLDESGTMKLARDRKAYAARKTKEAAEEFRRIQEENLKRT